MPLLEIEDVSVSFGGIFANRDVTFGVEGAQVTGLIGPNGAGKTTMFNVVSGLQEPTRGRLRLDGQDITKANAYKRARLGLARTFQRLEVFGSLSARDNVLVAAETRRRWSRDGSDPEATADELLALVGISEVAGERVDALPTGLARLVELARALATRPRLLLLDEPGSGLDHAESDAFGDLLIDLSRDGLGILIVEHDVDLVMRVCDQIFVLDFGELIASGAPAVIQADARVQEAYLGATPEVEHV